MSKNLKVAIIQEDENLDDFMIIRGILGLAIKKWKMKAQDRDEWFMFWNF